MGIPVIDIHLHFGAKNDPASGCYWSTEFESTLAFLAFRLVTSSLFNKPDLEHIQKHLVKVVKTSKKVDKCVFLALDQVYDEYGTCYDQHGVNKKTHLHVPNSYLAMLADEYSRVLFGASVHPFRPDWNNELQYCVQNKAVLCKWIPSSQQIDLTHSKCLPFFQKLADYKLPLLCHVGPEGAIPPFDKTSQQLNSPRHLRNALDAGATVIAAHAALPLFPPPFEDDSPYQELVSLFKEAESHGWHLYADLSAINLGPRGIYVDKIKQDIPASQLLFGSDYPIPILDISQKPNLTIGQWIKHFLQTVFIKNSLDKNYRLIKNMEFDNCIFTNAANVLKLN